MKPTILLLGTVLAAANALWASSICVAASYHDNRALDSTIRDVSDRGGFELEELCRDSRGEPVWLVTAGSGGPDDPAVLLVAGLDGRHLIGTEVALRVLDRLASDDDTTRALLQDRTLYVVPRVNRAGVDAFFSSSLRFDMAGVEGESDADRDGLVGEDRYEDLDGDGVVRWIRVEDARGDFRLEGEDEAFIGKADPVKGELGVWRWLREGRDEDGDERFHEEADGGVLLSRNFTHDYEFFAKGSGPYQVSEVETRALADFVAAHPHLAAVLVFGFEDNLMTPLPEGKKSSPRLSGSRWGRKPVDAPNENDLPLFLEWSRLYREDLGLGEKKTVSSGGYGQWPEAEGDAASTAADVAAKGGFAAWVYYTRGRAALATPVWTPGLQMHWEAEREAAEAEDETESETESGTEGESEGSAKEATDATDAPEEEAEDADEKAPKEDPKIGDERKLRDWWVAQDPDSWKDWTSFDHPDFPGQRVEVGGYDPFARINPPEAVIDSLVPAHQSLVHRMLAGLPKIVVRNARLENRGGGVYELRFLVENIGVMPDVLAQGVFATHVRPTRVELGLPQGAEVIGGPSRFSLDRLEGAGAQVEVRRLVLLPGGGRVTVGVISELGGRIEETVSAGGGR